MEDLMTKAEAQELRSKMDSLKSNFSDVMRHTKDRVVNDTTAWAKAHPAAAIGILAGVAAAIGFTVGLLIGRSGNNK